MESVGRISYIRHLPSVFQLYLFPMLTSNRISSSLVPKSFLQPNGLSSVNEQYGNHSLILQYEYIHNVIQTTWCRSWQCDHISPIITINYHDAMPFSIPLMESMDNAYPPL
eukprot:scaffold13556_cov280-Alexandrium_tamarense.AAC.5